MLLVTSLLMVFLSRWWFEPGHSRGERIQITICKLHCNPTCASQNDYDYLLDFCVFFVGMYVCVWLWLFLNLGCCCSRISTVITPYLFLWGSHLLKILVCLRWIRWLACLGFSVVLWQEYLIALTHLYIRVKHQAWRDQFLNMKLCIFFFSICVITVMCHLLPLWNMTGVTYKSI